MESIVNRATHKVAKRTKGAMRKTGKMTGIISKSKKDKTVDDEEDYYMDEEEDEYYDEQDDDDMYNGYHDEVSMTKANHILTSKGTHRLNRILRKSNNDDEDFIGMGMEEKVVKMQKLEDPKKPNRSCRILCQCSSSAPSNRSPINWWIYGDSGRVSRGHLPGISGLHSVQVL